MSDYEKILISAVRYALGRTTEIVEMTVSYILDEIENDDITDTCLLVIRNDIKQAKYLGLKRDQELWKSLETRIEEVI